MKFLKKNAGFTLVELMVVVAIIGILSAVAVPNFKKYQAKSKTSEAKLHLSAIYTAEQAFSSDYDTYATCLAAMGYNPTPEAAQRYYHTGFLAVHNAAVTPIITANGAQSCVTAPGGTAGTGFFPATKQVGSLAVPAVNAATLVGTQVPLATTFRAGAGGRISTTGIDAWTINEQKQLIHVTAGY